MAGNNNSPTSEILRTLTSQLPLMLMLIGGEFSYTKLISIGLPIMIMILINTDFTWFKSSRKIPKSYVQCHIKPEATNVRIFSHLSYFYNKYRYNEIKIGMTDSYLSTYNEILNSEILMPLIVPKVGFYDLIIINDNMINDFIENGIDEIIVDLKILKDKSIHLEIISGEIDDPVKNGEKITRPELVLYAESVNIINTLLIIIYNLKQTSLSKKRMFQLEKSQPVVDERGIIYSRSLNVTVKKNYGNVFLSKNNSNCIQEIIKEWVLSVDDNIAIGIPPKLGLLLTGPPGSGKSSTIYAIAEETKKHIFSINLQTMNDLTIVGHIQHLRNRVIVFEDIDCVDFVRNRTIHTNSKKSDKKSKNKKDHVSMDVFLEILDGYTYLQNCIIIMTTNHMEIIDPAVIRPGRIDHIINFDLCDTYQFRNIFKYYTSYNYVDINENFIFEENKYTSSYIINTILIPNKKNPIKILKLLSEETNQNVLI